jgi:hypothetical protein
MLLGLYNAAYCYCVLGKAYDLWLLLSNLYFFYLASFEFYDPAKLASCMFCSYKRQIGRQAVNIHITYWQY